MTTWQVTSAFRRNDGNVRELPADRNFRTLEEAQAHADKLTALGYVRVTVSPERFG